MSQVMVVVRWTNGSGEATTTSGCGLMDCDAVYW
jgi:hypothetical protein